MAGKDDDIDLDEIDQLLRAAEKKYGYGGSQQSAKQSTTKAEQPAVQLSTGRTGSGGRATKTTATAGATYLDELERDLAGLDDLMAPGGAPASSAKASKERQSGKTRPAGTDGNKCYPVLLGGSRCPLGLTSSGQQRSCNGLRCTRCDFKVLWFDGVDWADNCDYLFFRNSMPIAERLREKQRRRPGYRSFCCQCQWTAVNTTTNLLDHAQPKWVCSGHHPLS